MVNFEAEMISLITKLSEIKDNNIVIQSFIDEINKIFPSYKFEFLSSEIESSENSIQINTNSRTPAFITFEPHFKENEKSYLSFLNSVKLISNIIQKNELESLLENQKSHLQHLVDEQTDHLIQKQDELNEMNEEYSVLNEELITTNKSLFKLNELLQSQINERKQTQEKLSEQESQFRSIYEEGPLGMAFADKEGRFIMANNNFCQIMGFSEKELKKLTFKDITHPDHIIEDVENIQKLIRREIPYYKTEKRYIRKDESILWGYITLTAIFNEAGDFMYFLAMVEDITERVKAYELLKDSEYIFSKIFYKSPVSITITSRENSKIIDVNDVFLHDLEYTRDEVIGKSTLELGLFYDLRIREKLIQSMIEKGFVQNVECPFLTKNGKIMMGLVSMSMIKYKGKPHQLTTVIDITERKQAEIKLRESERFLNESQRVSAIGSYTLDIKKGCWIGSKYLLEMFGIDENYDCSVDGWVSLIHPDDKDVMFNYLTNDIFKKKGFFDKEYRIIKKNTGEVIWVHGFGELEIDKDGNPVKMIGTIQDISERKKAYDMLQKLSRAIEQSPNSVIITNKDGIIEYANFATYRMTGYNKDELLGKNLNIISVRKKPGKLFSEIWKTINSGGIWNGEFNSRMKNGTSFWEYLTISPIINSNGKSSNFLIIGEDITEKKKLTEELIKAKEKAEEADRLKSSFLANMSHEIRTPMNSIMGFASLLPDEESKDTLSQYAQIILQNSEQLVSIIDGIVMYSKLQTRMFAYHPSDFVINKLFKDIQQSFNLPEYNKDVDLIIEQNLSEEEMIKTDYDKLRQIFTNLISNAFKYTETGKITFGCKTNNKTIEFFVNDTGIGIPEKEKNLVFDRFYRGSNVNESKTRGTGLGLSIVKELVDLLGGKIWVESTIGIGTSFYFIIPREL